MKAEVLLHMVSGSIRPGTAVLIITATTTPPDENGSVLLAWESATIFNDAPGLPALQQAAANWIAGSNG